MVSPAAATMADALAKLADVEIDPEGTFKYILLRVNVKDGDASKDIVRGTKSAEYHSKWTWRGARAQCVAPATVAQMLQNQDALKPVGRFLTVWSGSTAASRQMCQHATH